MSLTEVVGKTKPANDAPKAAPKPPRKTNGDGAVSNFDRCRAYVAKMDPAISGSGGHTATLDVVRACNGFDLTSDETIDILHEFNRRCQPPWSDKELAHKATYLGKFRKYATGYILDKSQDWEPQRQAARAAIPIDDDDDSVIPEPPDDLPPLFEADETDATPTEDHDQGPAGDHARKDFFEGSVAGLTAASLCLVERRMAGTEFAISTGFPDYDAALEDGYWPGLHTIVGGTGSRKTELATSVCNNAMDCGVPTNYVSLELEAQQVMLRMLGRRASVPWSKLYLGKCSENQMQRAQEAAGSIQGKPFRVISGAAGGWAPSRLHQVVQEARKSRSSGPLMVVLDFLQLVGPEPMLNGELRERIGAATYAGRQVAREFGAAVLLISSTARDKYALVSSAMEQAGLGFSKRPGDNGFSRTIDHPHTLVGLGKEAGEIEFACDSLTVLSRWPSRLDNGDSLLVCAVPKLRYGRESWFALAAAGGTRLTEYRCSCMADLPTDDADGDEDYLTTVVQTVARVPGLRSANDIVKAARQGGSGGNRQKLLAAVRLALEKGQIASTPDGFEVVPGNGGVDDE